MQGDDIDQDRFVRVIKFAKMQDEFFFRWKVECDELQVGIDYYISQGKTEVTEILKDYSDFFIEQVSKDQMHGVSVALSDLEIMNDLGRAPSEELLSKSLGKKEV